MNSRLKTIVTLLTLILVFASLAMIAVNCSRSLDSSPGTAGENPVVGTNIGNLAPDFHLQSLDGEAVSLSGLRGRPVLLNFWASWCGPCRSEMPFLQEIFDDGKWADEGLAILAVNIGESPVTVKEFLMVNRLSLPVLLDVKQDVAQQYNTRNIPMTFFIGKDGIIRDRVIGAFPDKSEIEKRLTGSIVEK